MSAGSFGISQPVRRVEDARLLAGGGRYSDDTSLPGQAYGAFLRSPFGHGDIRVLDVSAARAAPGVLGVWTGEDLAAAGVGPIPNVAPLPWWDGRPLVVPPRPALSRGRVRHAGEPVAFVVAETQAQAEDALDLIVFDVDALPAVVDPAEAVIAGAPVLWDHAPDNVALDWRAGDFAAVDKAMAGAAHVVKLCLANNRLVGNPMEPRSALASYNAASGRYTLVAGSQGVSVVKAMLAEPVLKVTPDKLQVITNDVGGGFGIKTQAYPEYAVILVAAKALGRPVKWRGTRAETFLADNAARDGVIDGELALDRDGRFLALRVDHVAAMGAYLSAHGTAVPTRNVANCLPSVYTTPAISYRVRCVYTNTAPIGPYRGAGRPEAAYIVERLIDEAARVTGIDRIELRRRNFIVPAAFPYKTPIGPLLDSGDFVPMMERAMELADWKGFAARRAEAASSGKLRGIGLAMFLETAGAFLTETTEIRFAGDGTLRVATAAQSNGQGHATAFAQVVAERLGVPFDSIRIVEGDSDVVPVGLASVASRSMFMAGCAIAVTCDAIVEKGRVAAGEVLEAAAADIEFADGVFRVAGTDRSIPVLELAKALRRRGGLEDEAPGGLDSKEEYKAPEQTFPNGCHVCEVEIDPGTGVTSVVGYAAVDDCGVVVNPMIVHGQVHGGVAQGLGQVLGEHCIYDGDGQLVTGSFMDYQMPRATDMPPMRLAFHPVPCRTNPLGVKGAGEAGTTGALPAAMNAICDALAARGITQIDAPATPLRVWAALAAG